MTRPLLIALAGAAVIVNATACGTSTAPSPAPSQSPSKTTTSASGSTTASPATSTAAASSACTGLGGTVGPDQICTVHEATAKYTIDMTFPDGYPDQPAITALLTTQRSGFLDILGDRPQGDDPYALDITNKEYRSGAPDPGTRSVVFEEYVNVGGAHPETSYDALNYDVGKGKPITFDTLFKPGADAVAVLDPIVTAELEKRLQGYSVEPNPAGATTYRNFAITDTDLIFFLGQGEWTIEAAGSQEVSVPRSKLASILA